MGGRRKPPPSTEILEFLSSMRGMETRAVPYVEAIAQVRRAFGTVAMSAQKWITDALGMEGSDLTLVRVNKFGTVDAQWRLGSLGWMELSPSIPQPVLNQSGQGVAGSQRVDHGMPGVAFVISRSLLAQLRAAAIELDTAQKALKATEDRRKAEEIERRVGPAIDVIRGLLVAAGFPLLDHYPVEFRPWMSSTVNDKVNLSLSIYDTDLINDLAEHLRGLGVTPVTGVEAAKLAEAEEEKWRKKLLADSTTKP